MSVKNTFQQIGNQIIQKSGIEPRLGGGTDPTGTTQLPWGVGGRSSIHSDPFYQPIDIKPDRWNKVFPYRLLVIDVERGNQLVDGGGDLDIAVNEKDTGGIQIRMQPINRWEFQLPITPQQIAVTDPFAINTFATARGVVEEHNGVKFKILQASGTTGIWPNRNTVDDNFGKSNDTAASIGELLGGTISAAADLVRTFDRVRNTLNGGYPVSKPVASDPVQTDLGGITTGYYQAQLLQQFLEQYAMAKKDPKNKGWRLVFDYPKENQSYIVTPIAYVVTKSQGSPAEHLFNIQLKIWKRINLRFNSPTVANEVMPLDTNTFRTIVNSVNEARRAMSAATNLVQAVRADFRRPFDLLRQTALLTKDLGGFVFSVADLPNNIISDISSSVRGSVDIFRNAFNRGLRDGTDPSGRAKNTLDNIISSQASNEGLNPSAVQAGQLGFDATNFQQTDPVNEIFDNPEANFDFFNTIEIDDLPLNFQQQQAVQNEIQKANILSVQDIKNMQRELEQLSLDISNQIGGGSEAFSKFYNMPDPRDRGVPMTPEEMDILFALEDAIFQLSVLTATRELDDRRASDSLEFVGGLAEQSNIDFEIPRSKFLAPVPFGLTIEQISSRYLGNPDRWIEIATLNNLKSPYIDEDGFFRGLLSNGFGRQFNIESDENLFIGQQIMLSSDSEAPFPRRISGIERIAENNYLITTDGLDDLDRLTIGDNARMQAFLPGTVNSQNRIFIPSDIEIPDESRLFQIPFIDYDDLTSLARVDWLLTEDGDIAINNFGDFRLATGLTNIIQAIRMKLITVKGKILGESEYGLGIKPGTISSEVDFGDIFTGLQEMIIADPRFETIESFLINMQPPEMTVELSIRLSGGRGVFPLSVTLSD